MNLKQTIVMWIGIIAIVLMGLFPPWNVECGGAGNRTLWVSRYKFIFTPPEFADCQKFNASKEFPDLLVLRSRCDFALLTIQWLIVAVISGGLIVTLRCKKTRQDGSE